MYFFASVVILTSIILFFLDEWSALGKKILTKPEEHMLLPLLFISVLVMYFEYAISLFAFWIQAALSVFVLSVINLPYLLISNHTLTAFVCLFGLISLPVHGVYWLMKCNAWGNPARIASYMYLFLWLFVSLLWVSY